MNKDTNGYRKISLSLVVILAILVVTTSCTETSSGGGEANCGEPGMVIFDAQNEKMCIDALEVTNTQFVAFLNENGNDCAGHECIFVDEMGSKISADGEMFVVADGFGDFPVVQVTFYGAEQFCAQRGAFVCPSAAWVAACKGPLGTTYPYGSTYQAEACNGTDVGNEAPVAAGTLATCEGGISGLFDMSGNVYEWSDACAQGNCLIHGGSFEKSSADLTCDGIHTMDGPSGHREDLGLRCCANASLPL